MSKKIFGKNIWRLIALFSLSLGLLWTGLALAANDTAGGLGDLATGITNSFSQFGSLMIATAYLAGIAFTIMAIFKFKQHRDNPTQVPMGTPIALLVIGIVLIFLPGIIKPAGTTLLGTTGTPETEAGGFTGTGATQIPGANK